MQRFNKVAMTMFLACLLAMTAACNDEDEEVAGNNSDNDNNEETPEENLDENENNNNNQDLNEEGENNENNGREAVETSETDSGAGDAPDDQGDNEVRWEVEVEEQGDHYIVTGESNLLPDSTVRIRVTSNDYTFTGYNENMTVEADGSFEAELNHPEVYDTELVLLVEMLPSNQPDEVLDHYGEDFGNMEGPFVYLNYDEKDEIEYKVKSELDYAPQEDDFVTLQSEMPEWNFPEDQGELDVWIDEVDVERDDERFFITGESNLEEGAVIQLQIDLPDYISFGFSETTPVNPDGSFETNVRYPDDIDEDAEMNIEINFRPFRNNQMAHIEEHYGPEGENFEGDLIEMDGDNQFIQLLLNVQ